MSRKECRTVGESGSRCGGWKGKGKEDAEGAKSHNSKKNGADASPVDIPMCWNFFYIISII